MNILSGKRRIDENPYLRNYSQIVKNNKINKILRRPVKNKKVHEKFKQALIKIRGLLMWLEILKNLRIYGTNSHLFDSFGRYRKDIAERLSHKNRIFTTKTENVKDYGLIISPESKFCQIWNIIVLFMLLYVFIVMPWVMAFEEVVMFNHWFIAETFMDFLFFLDIIITLNTAYYDIHGRIIAIRKKICLNYLKGFMLIDIISITPFYLIEQGKIIRSNSLVRIIRITSITRVLRGSKILKLIKYLKYSEEIARIIRFMKLYRGVIRLMTLVFFVLVMSHFIACMFYFTAKVDGFSPSTWVIRYDLQDLPKEIKYLKSLYFTITILTTVGFGDIVPYTSSEMILCIVWMSLGIGFYSSIVSTISSVFRSMDSRRFLISEKISCLDKLGKYYQVNRMSLKYIKQKVNDRVKDDEKICDYDRKKIFNEMPRKIQLSIIEFMYNQAVKKVNFFHNKDANFLSDILPTLNHVTISYLCAIYNKNDYAENVYFLISGRVSYVMGNTNLEFKSIVPGSYFGEIEILINQPRKFTAVAEDICEMLLMSSGTLDDIMVKYPIIGDEIWALAKKKENKNLECFIQVAELLDKVEIRKEKSFSDLAGKKYSKKERKRHQEERGTTEKQVEENIAQDLIYIEDAIRIAKFKVSSALKLY
ncbi:hypothetical protein SteCoe_31977 [Stentor coeruleus]|uniref:Cyclic nucleotide-binding domain-containing protein n=1 Tax=Stentor coeruleus TaxID=5963 RepID=A0A1R2B004_9CILI|nr:hypothetical protein SteCoe_31977 [Stentor coeruleus]